MDGKSGSGDVLTRDAARRHWAATGIDLKTLKGTELMKLRNMVDEELKSCGLIDGLRADGGPRTTRRRGAFFAEIRCASVYFANRQAITFEENGFIGIAGWADDVNVQPFLAALHAWIDDIHCARRDDCGEALGRG